MGEAGGHKRNRNVGSIREFLVQWAPETCSFLEVQKQRADGFYTLSLDILDSVCDPELDADDVASPCHSCHQGAGDQTSGPPLPMRTLLSLVACTLLAELP